MSAAQSDDPADATNKVAKFVKGPTGQPWAGATIYTIDATKSVPKFDLSGSKIVTVRVYSPAAGLTVRLKLEDAANNAIYLEKDALTTKANEWETLSFDFATPVNGVYNPANTYNRVSLFPVFSTTAPPASNVTFYFDELDYTTTGGGGANGACRRTATVIPAGSVTIYSDAASGTGLDPFPNWGQSPPVTSSEVTIAGNKSLKYVWAGPGGLYQGIDWSSNPVDVSAKGKLHIDFWTPDLASVKVSIISAGQGKRLHAGPDQGGWNSVDIDLSNYTVPDKAAIIQIKLEPTRPGHALRRQHLLLGHGRRWQWQLRHYGAGLRADDGDPGRLGHDLQRRRLSDGARPVPLLGPEPAGDEQRSDHREQQSLQYVWAGPGGLYQGIDWSSNPVDVSAKGKLHIDFWTPDLASVKVSIISAGLENAYTQALTTGGWNSVDIDLSNYTVPNKTAIIQIKLEPNAPGTLYVDNIYFGGTAGGGGGTALTSPATTSPVSTEPDDRNWTSDEGGAAGTYIDTSVATLYWWSGVAQGRRDAQFLLWLRHQHQRQALGLRRVRQGAGQWHGGRHRQGEPEDRGVGQRPVDEHAPHADVAPEGAGRRRVLIRCWQAALPSPRRACRTTRWPLSSFTLQSACALRIGRRGPGRRRQRGARPGARRQRAVRHRTAMPPATIQTG